MDDCSTDPSAYNKGKTYVFLGCATVATTRHARGLQTRRLGTLNLALERNKERITRLGPFGALDNGRKEMADSRCLLPEKLVTPCIRDAMHPLEKI
jgi:hypothetical protein